MIEWRRAEVKVASIREGPNLLPIDPEASATFPQTTSPAPILNQLRDSHQEINH